MKKAILLFSTTLIILSCGKKDDGCYVCTSAVYDSKETTPGAQMLRKWDTSICNAAGKDAYMKSHNKDSTYTYMVTLPSGPNYATGKISTVTECK